MYQCADFVALHNLLQVAYDVHVEHVDRQVVLLAHCGGCEVHHLQTACVDFVVSDVGELRSCRVLLGIGCVDAVDACALQHHVCLNLDTAERRAGVGGEVGRASAGREDADISCLHSLDSLPLRVELADRLHADSCEHLSLHAQCAERRAERERVDNGSAHAHLVALHAVEAFRCTAESAEDVAATDDDANLHAHFVYFLDLLCVFAQTNGVDTEALLAHEALATELEENSLEFCHVVCFVCFICYCWGVLSAWLVHLRGVRLSQLHQQSCWCYSLLGALLLGWCTLGGAAVSAAPTELLVPFFGWCTS